MSTAKDKNKCKGVGTPTPIDVTEFKDERGGQKPDKSSRKRKHDHFVGGVDQFPPTAAAERNDDILKKRKRKKDKNACLEATTIIASVETADDPACAVKEPKQERQSKWERNTRKEEKREKRAKGDDKKSTPEDCEMTDATAAAVEESSAVNPTKKPSLKKRRKADELDGNAIDATLDVAMERAEYRKEKKERQKHVGNEVLMHEKLAEVGVETHIMVEDEVKANKRKKKTKPLEGVATQKLSTISPTQATDSSGKTKKKEITQPEFDEQEERTVNSPELAMDKSILKPKDKSKKSRSSLGGVSTPFNDSPSPSKSKHKVDLYPTLEGTEILSEQAQKALAYANAQLTTPSSWKFNKARQNWLIRNMWNAEQVPDLYVQIVFKYLAYAKGGTREVLIKACNDALHPIKPLQAKDKPGNDAADDNTSDTTGLPNPSIPVSILKKSPDQKIKQSRASQLLAKFGTTQTNP